MRLPFVSCASFLVMTCFAVAGCSGETSTSGTGASEADYSEHPINQSWLHCLPPGDISNDDVVVEAVHPARGAFGEVHGDFWAKKVGSEQEVVGNDMTVTRDGSTYTFVGSDAKLVVTNVTSIADGTFMPGASVTVTTSAGNSATFDVQCAVDFRSGL